MSTAVGYSGLFGLTGYRYIVVAFIARLPLAMSQLGTLLLVATTTKSYTQAGICAGALAVCNAVGAPWFGSLTDRHGQSRVLMFQCVAGTIGLFATVATRYFDLHWVATAVVAALTGFVLPQVGQLARVRWRPIIVGRKADDRLVGTAFSYEGAADEASFVVGPVLVGAAAAALGTWAPLLAAAVLLGLFGIQFARHPSSRFAPTPVGTSKAPLWTAAFTVLVAAQFFIGNLFGSIQTGTTLLTQLAGHPESSGLFHALLGIGSVSAGIALGRLTKAPNHPKRLLLFATAMWILSLPLLAVDNLTLLAAELVILGFAIAPYMITTFTLGELITHRSRTATAMTLLAGATGLGYATGAALAGRLVDEGGVAPAFKVTLAATTLAFVLAVGAKRLLSRTTHAN
ncbi:MFS transporter [Dermacoccus sp. PAMC28757]|uniref:MFS transporter n=1 Tax=Dermacoccus sp. PAMC28757 TaxID=2762331 RepID=UPI0021025006|nr:MFS transporter [Dermacoccus sp. PAMC28757]